MITEGKTLFFNESDGHGIIITVAKEKINFNVEEWNDYDLMPTTGLEVVFDLEGESARNIVAKANYTPEVETPQNDLLENVQEDLVEEQQIEEEIVQDETPEENHEAFEDEVEINVLEDEEIQDVLEEERPTSITNTLNLSTAITNYFNIIKENIDKRKAYKQVDGRLDYLLVRRFLWTTYNNLTDIDIKIITPKIRTLGEDLLKMSNVYDDFRRKTNYPSLAYEEVFLSCQAEYLKIREGAERIIEKLTRLKYDEKKLGGSKEVKKKELEESINTEQFTLLEDELKSLNGTYVDVVHMMGELDERYKSDMKLLHDFEQEYRDDFYKLFAVEAEKHEYDLVEILNAQAFIFDIQLWHKAKSSKSVKAHFKKSSISGELNTRTYLKYYLSTQDELKASEETKKLFKLYAYLNSIHKDYILIVTASSEDALDYEASVKSIEKTYDVKSFIDELSAIKWAMKNSVKVLVLEDELTKVRAGRFLEIYSKNVLSTPKVVLLGDRPQENKIPIGKLVARGASPRIVAQAIRDVIEAK